MSPRLRALLREPLLHFLVLGAALFALFDLRGGGATGRIVVGAGTLEHLAAGFTRTWQRPPTEAELKGLVDEHVKEEMAAREATAAGLDKDDAIIRKRLRQKLEFLAEDEADRGPPTEAELSAWLAAHPERFRTEQRVALRQVFLRPDRPGAEARAEAALARLRAAGPAADLAGLGDPSTLAGELPDGPLREVALTFGEAFARALEAAPVGAWTGPITSTYGLHLVLVGARSGGGVPALAEVRPLVEREVVAERRRAGLARLYEGLARKYQVVVERPAGAAAGAR